MGANWLHATQRSISYAVSDPCRPSSGQIFIAGSRPSAFAMFIIGA